MAIPTDQQTVDITEFVNHVLKDVAYSAKVFKYDQAAVDVIMFSSIIHNIIKKMLEDDNNIIASGEVLKDMFNLVLKEVTLGIQGEKVDEVLEKHGIDLNDE